jgi:RHS repeat-associated protein
VKVSLANASGTNAWFDDLVLSRFPVPTKQENHYDPFGQNLEELELASSFDSKAQYTGKEWVKDFGLEWTDYGFRNYDAQLGRWHSTDPVNQFDFPYTAMGNNPVNRVDGDGR